VLKLC